MVYIDRRPFRLPLKLFLGRMAIFEKTEKSVSLKFFLFFFNNLLILIRRRDAKSMVLNNFCKLFQLRTIWYRIELMPYFVVLA